MRIIHNLKFYELLLGGCPLLVGLRQLRPVPPSVHPTPSTHLLPKMCSCPADFLWHFLPLHKLPLPRFQLLSPLLPPVPVPAQSFRFRYKGHIPFFPVKSPMYSLASEYSFSAPAEFVWKKENGVMRKRSPKSSS